jgi:excisionase family DNA binding protein
MENQITATIAEFCRMTGIGRSSVYELISEGAIASITMGRRRLIVIESYRALVARKQAAEQHGNGRAQGATPPARAS